MFVNLQLSTGRDDRTAQKYFSIVQIFPPTPRIPLFVRPFITKFRPHHGYMHHAYRHVSGSRIMHHASIQVFRRYMHHTCFHQMYAPSWSGDAFNIHALVHHTYIADIWIHASSNLALWIHTSRIHASSQICIIDSCINGYLKGGVAGTKYLSTFT